MADGLPRVAAPVRKIPRALRDIAVAARADVVRVTEDPKLTDRCAVASVYLQVIAAEKGFDLELVGGEVHIRQAWYRRTGHLWCEYQGWIVDLSATQFWSVPEVYVTSVTNGRYTEHDRGLVTFGRCTHMELVTKLLTELGVNRFSRGRR